MAATAPPCDPRPASAVSGMCGLAGLLGLTAWILLARNFGAVAAALGVPGLPARADGPLAALCCVIATGLPVLLWSVAVDKVHRRASTGIDWAQRRPLRETLDISIVKIAGLWATWGGIAIVYATARFYWAPPYVFSMQLFAALAVPLVLLSVPYVLWLDRRLVEPRDDCWHFGVLVAGQQGADRTAIARHLRAWTVKGFFLAFMLSIVPGGYADLVNRDVASALADPVALTTLLIGAMFVVDVQFATVGYLVTARPFDAHIRSANPSMAGWVAALACYPPFVLMNRGGPLDYHVGTQDWSEWFAAHPPLLWAWGMVLVLLTAFYAWATVAFGPRFSNLTNRGIITHGPYAVSRHPAYLAKNIYWWLATLPFLVTTQSKADALRNTALLGLVSAIYWWRAKTEERHLSADPAYFAYWQWMERHGPVPRLFARLTGRRGAAVASVRSASSPAEAGAHHRPAPPRGAAGQQPDGS